MIPMLILHVAVAITSFHRPENVRVCVAMELIYVWLQPGFDIHHFLKHRHLDSYLHPALLAGSLCDYGYNIFEYMLHVG